MKFRLLGLIAISIGVFPLSQCWLLVMDWYWGDREFFQEYFYGSKSLLVETGVESWAVSFPAAVFVLFLLEAISFFSNKKGFFLEWIIPLVPIPILILSELPLSITVFWLSGYVLHILWKLFHKNIFRIVQGKNGEISF